MTINFTNAIATLDRETDLEAEKWFREQKKIGFIGALRKMVGQFWKAYFSRQGHKDGVIGLFLSVNSGMRQFLSFTKYWELKRGFRISERQSIGTPKHRDVGAPRTRQTVSAVIMTKNCEDLIEGTLKSVEGWVDEIVVLDGFSTDKTIDICRRYTDKVFQNRWDGYRFCTERNLGTSKVTSDWCFHIDPDERATPEFKEAVLKIMEIGTPHSAFEFHKKNFFLGHWMRYGGWYHYSLHFFKKGKAHYDGVIHESLLVDGTIGKIEAAVEHYPFTSIKQFVNRHNGYSTREGLAKFESEGRLPEPEVLYNLKRKPIKRFMKFFIRKKGFLDGKYGLIFSVLFAWVHFLNWAKYWEIAYLGAHENSTH